LKFNIDQNSKRDKIILAALQVFRQKGFGRATVSEIAVLAEIGKGTVYEYFRSKEEIVHQALHFLLNHIRLMLKDIVDQPLSPREKLIALTSMFNWMEEKHTADDVFILADYWAEAVRDHRENNPLTKDFELFYKEIRGLYKAVIEEGVRQGCFRPVSQPEALAAAIAGMLDGLFFQWFLNRDAVSLRESSETFLDCLFEGMARE
jgi:AcrR family transcriptional regulator